MLGLLLDCNCHHMYWILSLPVSYTASWTTAALFLLVYQLATFNVCSPFLTQPYVWSPAHRDVITWPLCCAIATGFLLSSASSTSCVRLFIVVCTATHHPTYGRPHQAVCCCKCQSSSEICWVDDRRSTRHAVIIWRPLFCDRRSACVKQATVTPPSDAVRWHF